MLLFYQYFQGRNTQTFQSKKIYIPTDVQIEIFFSVSLSFHFSFSLKKFVSRKCNCPVSTHSLPSVTLLLGELFCLQSLSLQFMCFSFSLCKNNTEDRFEFYAGERGERMTSPVIYYTEECLNMRSLSVFLLCSMCICTDKFRITYFGQFQLYRAISLSLKLFLLMVLICTFVLFLSFSQTIARSYRGDSYVCHPLKEQISVVI